MILETLAPDRLSRAKAAYTVRRVPTDRMRTIVGGKARPSVGDLVLARVDEIGKHGGIEQAAGRKSTLFPGDEIILAYGNRYAPDQFEAEIPDDLGPCHMVAGGGLASRMITAHTAIKEEPTAITPIGLIADERGRVLRVADGAMTTPAMLNSRVPVIGVVGTSMNAGKTTSAAYLVHGLTLAGHKVGACKVTGTGAGKDMWLMRDAGAIAGYDFTDAGCPSTYLLSPSAIEAIIDTITAQLVQDGADVIVMEIADGLYQRETSVLIQSAYWRRLVATMVFAAGDAMGAVSGALWLVEQGLPLVAVSGAFTASPLASREAASVLSLPVLGLEDLVAPTVPALVLPMLMPASAERAS